MRVTAQQMANALDMSRDATVSMCFHDVVVAHMCPPLQGMSGALFAVRLAGHMGQMDRHEDKSPDAVIPDDEIISFDLIMGPAQFAHLIASLTDEHVKQIMCEIDRSRTAEILSAFGSDGPSAVDIVRNLFDLGKDGGMPDA